MLGDIYKLMIFTAVLLGYHTLHKKMMFFGVLCDILKNGCETDL